MNVPKLPAGVLTGKSQNDCSDLLAAQPLMKDSPHEIHESRPQQETSPDHKAKPPPPTAPLPQNNDDPPDEKSKRCQ